MSKRPTDGDEPHAKKRGSSRQITKDDASDEEEEERGSIQTATDEVMKARRVVKARRAGPGAPPPTPVAGVPAAAAPSLNPFAGVTLATGGGGGTGSAVLTASQPEAEAALALDTANKEETANVAKDDKKSDGYGPGMSEEKPAPAFASFAGTAAPFAATAGSGQAFSFGSAAAGAPKAEFGETGANGAASAPFSFSTVASGSGLSFKPTAGSFPPVQSVFGSKESSGGANRPSEVAGSESTDAKPALATLPPETGTVTGEEDETTLWSGDGVLYEFGERQWRERGKGELRVNRGPGRPARFVMRGRVLRLIMNARLWPDMKVTRMDGGKGVTFPVVNAAGQETPDKKPELQTFAFRLKNPAHLDSLVEAIEKNKKGEEETGKK